MEASIDMDVDQQALTSSVRRSALSGGIV